MGTDIFPDLELTDRLTSILTTVVCRLPFIQLAGPLKTLAFLFLRSPILCFHVTMCYCWRVQSIQGSV
jgi:hypothetical protein